MIKLYSNGLQKLNTIILYAFVFCMPLYQKLSTILLVLWVAISLFKLTKKNKIDFRPYLIPVILYVLMGVTLFYSETVELKYLENRASFIAFPLIFTSLSLNEVIFKTIIRYFVLGCLIALATCYSNAIYNSFNWVDGAFVFKPVVSGDFSFFDAVVRDGNYFFSGFFSIFHDTIYFSMYLNMAIAGILSFQLWKRNTWYIFAILFCAMAVFQLSSKIGIITCFLIFTIYIVIKAKNRAHRILIPLAIVVVGALFFLQNPRGKTMIDKFTTEGLTIDPNERFGYTLRLMSWDTALDLIKENPILGVGVGDAQEELNKKYDEKGYNTPGNQHHNTHNTFIQIMLECGIIGLTLILAMIYYLFITLKKGDEKQIFFNGFFLLILLLAFLFESVLNRFSGIVFFMFFYCLFTKRNEHVGKD